MRSNVGNVLDAVAPEERYQLVERARGVPYRVDERHDPAAVRPNARS
jgi:hypothetical protein